MISLNIKDKEKLIYPETFDIFLPFISISNRPGVPGAVVQTLPLLIKSVSHSVIICETRRGSPVDRRPSIAEVPLIG